MDINDFKIQIKQIYNDVNDAFFHQIEIYKNFLCEYNQHTNLTRLDDESKIYQEYFFDSVVPYKDLEWKQINNVLDIGSGSGIPGIVLKLLFPWINLTIIEANQKKSIFLTKLINLLNINITLINKRAEQIQNIEREKFDLVTSRAVAPLPIILEISIPYCKIGGMIIEPKGSNYMQEYKYTNRIVESCGGKLLPIKKTTVGVNIIVLKNKQTNKTYPRPYKDIVKEYESR